MANHPRITSLKRHNGVAGAYAYNVTVLYPLDEPRMFTFYGSHHGDWVILETYGGSQVRVTEPERFGPRLSAEWVREFFGDHGGTAGVPALVR